MMMYRKIDPDTAMSLFFDRIVNIKIIILSSVYANQNPPPNLIMPFTDKELQQFCLHLNNYDNTSQTLGYQDCHYFDGESGQIPTYNFSCHFIVFTITHPNARIYLIPSIRKLKLYLVNKIPLLQMASPEVLPRSAKIPPAMSTLQVPLGTFLIIKFSFMVWVIYLQVNPE
jgi:hypothetical protein